jgi:BlaI family penicillinase repressor
VVNVRFLSYLGAMKVRKDNSSKETVPTRSEMDVLQILWQHGPSTVRFVHDTLNEQKEEGVQYTSTLKLMQVMAEKGMLTRDESSMKHIYSAALEEKTTKGTILSRFVDSMYDGSVSNLMVALLGNDKTSKKELQVLKEMLKKLDDKA